MKTLTTNRRVLTWLCVSPFDPNISILKKAYFVFMTLFLFVFKVSGVVSSAAFFIINASVDLEGSLYALFQVAGYSGLIPISYKKWITCINIALSSKSNSNFILYYYYVTQMIRKAWQFYIMFKTITNRWIHIWTFSHLNLKFYLFLYYY